jgi:hypothetical protein
LAFAVPLVPAQAASARQASVIRNITRLIRSSARKINSPAGRGQRGVPFVMNIAVFFLG